MYFCKKLFEGYNLLRENGPTDSQYVKKVMDLLFSKEEMLRNIIFTDQSLPAENKTRGKLDQVRVDLLKGNFLIIYCCLS